MPYFASNLYSHLNASSVAHKTTVLAYVNILLLSTCAFNYVPGLPQYLELPMTFMCCIKF